MNFVMDVSIEFNLFSVHKNAYNLKMPLGLFLEKLHPTREGAQTDTCLNYTRLSNGTTVGLVGGRVSVER